MVDLISKIKSEFKGILSKWFIFLLLFVPTTTEYLEDGKFFRSLRELITDVVMTTLMGVFIVIIYWKNKQLENISFIDHLTGIGNRRQFDIDLKNEISRSKRTNNGLCVIFLDLDGFKEINDRFGHEEGDKVLIAFAHGLQLFCRNGTDNCYRFGGDEFAVMLGNLNVNEYEKIIDNIQRRLESTVYDKLQKGVSASRGIVFWNANETYQELLKRADDAMYNAKHLKFSLRCISDSQL